MIELLKILVSKYKFDPVHLVWVAVIVLFILQARYLHLVSMPITDESLYAEAGRMIMEGYVPFRDFSHPHAPVLAFFSGVIHWLTGSMYPVRLLFLTINCASVILLYYVIRSMTKSALAALIGVAFYLGYHEMLHHDFRLLAVRQFANAFFILFLYLTFARPPSKTRTILRSIVAPLTTLIFLQNALYLALIGMADILSQPKKKRSDVLWDYIWLGGITILVLAAFMLIIPNSWDLMLGEHLADRPAIDRRPRLTLLFSSPDKLFYALGIASLLGTAVLLPRLRYYALAMFGIILAVLIPREFWPHYYVGSAPAYAFGAATFILLLQEICKEKYRMLALSIAFLLVAVQWYTTYPSLLHEWMNNRDDRYYAVIEQLEQLPDPLLTFIASIYSVQANKEAVYHYYRPEWRMFGHFGRRLTSWEFRELTDQACTILVSSLDHRLVGDRLEQWAEEFEEVPVNGPERIFLTHHAHCP